MLHSDLAELAPYLAACTTLTSPVAPAPSILDQLASGDNDEPGAAPAKGWLSLDAWASGAAWDSSLILAAAAAEWCWLRCCCFCWWW